MFCKYCGKEIEESSKFCEHCGKNLNEEPQTIIREVHYCQPTQAKSQFLAIILCLFLGLLGIHDFYMGNNGRGVAKLLIILLLGWLYIGFFINAFWCLCDFIVILSKDDKCFREEKEESI